MSEKSWWNIKKFLWCQNLFLTFTTISINDTIASNVFTEPINSCYLDDFKPFMWKEKKDMTWPVTLQKGDFSI